MNADLPSVLYAMGLALVVTTATILGIVLRRRLTRTP
jgi:hypothetical protein